MSKGFNLCCKKKKLINPQLVSMNKALLLYLYNGILKQWIDFSDQWTQI